MGTPEDEAGRAERAWAVLRGRAARSQPRTAALLYVVAVALGLAVAAQPLWFVPSAFVLLLLVGAFLLRWRALVVLVVEVVVLVVVLVLVGPAAPAPGVLTVIGLACVAVLVFARERERLGLQGAPGALMLVDLRDRLAAAGRMPTLPSGWVVDADVRSAHEAAFSGDFLVSRVVDGGRRLEVVLVDVSGKGQDAGVRSLQLSGAFSGLLGAMPPERFLPAANAYLVGQAWDEGFATAVHLTIDLRTGDYRVATAGHPPPAVLHAGSGRIEVLTTAGPALGVLDDVDPVPSTGRLHPGDAVVLYTDGVVEQRGRDVDQGIDRLLGVVESAVAARPGGARDVLAGVRAGDDDDRAVVVVRRG